MKTRVLTTLTIALFLTAVSVTHAIPMLRVSDGLNAPITITDNGAGDLAPAVGHLNYANANYFGWNIIVSSGVTKPIVGSATSPALDLNYQIIRNANSQGTLTILFSENGFNLASPSTMETSAGGILGNSGNPSINVRTYYDLGNTELVTTTLLTSHLFTGQGGYAGNDIGGPVGPDSSIAFTMRIDLSIPVGAVSSGDIDLHLNNVPEGGSMITFLGTALFGLGILAIRRRNARAV
jgi:hypothetical protein